MPLLESTKKKQYKLARYCRGQSSIDLKQVRQERLPVYRRLVYNNIYATLKNAYPLAYNMMETEKWDSLVEGFVKSEAFSDPQLWKMPYALINYTKKNNLAKAWQLPFLDDLLRFEWLEIDVFMMPDLNFEYETKKSDKSTLPIMNKEYRIERFSYPVFKRANPEKLHQEGEYFLLMYRKPSDFQVGVLELSALHVLFFEALVNKIGTTLNELIEAVLEAFELEKSSCWKQKLHEFLLQLESQELILDWN